MSPPIVSVLDAPKGTPVQFWYGNRTRFGVSLCRIGDEILIRFKPKANAPDEYYRGQFDDKGYFTPRQRYTESQIPAKWRRAIEEGTHG